MSLHVRLQNQKARRRTMIPYTHPHTPGQRASGGTSICDGILAVATIQGDKQTSTGILDTRNFTETSPSEHTVHGAHVESDVQSWHTTFEFSSANDDRMPLSLGNPSHPPLPIHPRKAFTRTSSNGRRASAVTSPAPTRRISMLKTSLHQIPAAKHSATRTHTCAMCQQL